MKLKCLLRFTSFVISVLFKVNIGSPELIVQHGSKWIITEFEDKQTLEKDVDPNMDFFFSEGSNGVCVNGVYGRNYPLIMLKNNQPMLIIDSVKQTMTKPSVNCENMFNYANSNDIVYSDAPESLTDE